MNETERHTTDYDAVPDAVTGRWLVKRAGITTSMTPDEFAAFKREHTAEIDLREIVREAYLLGYQDRAAERDYDPGRALDLLPADADTREP
jgi:hypothetical protein